MVSSAGNIPPGHKLTGGKSTGGKLTGGKLTGGKSTRRVRRSKRQTLKKRTYFV
jgi:hypothetical protein